MNFSYITAYILIIGIGFTQIFQVITDDEYDYLINDHNHTRADTGTSEVTEERKIGSVTTSSLPSTSMFTEPLPDDDASWETIRERGKVYVDKTGTLEYLMNCGFKLFFFTRPRRFGKSLFLKMMKSFFGGEKPHLFEGLKIFERGNIKLDETRNETWIKYAVIHLDFGHATFSLTGTYKEKLKEFEAKLKGMLARVAIRYGVDSTQPDFGLTSLIQDLYTKFDQPVVILFDEYDAPISSALHSISKSSKLASGIAEILESSFVEIKTNTDCLRFVWVTGITKLGLAALESGPNNFVDVTLTKELATAVGFTKEEITTYFKSHIQVLCNAYEFKEKKMMEKLIEMYDGYKFSIDSDIRVFNPISVLSSLRNKRIDNYWQATCSVSYIIRRMWEEHYAVSSFENLKHTRQFLFLRRDPTKEVIPLAIYMLLTGYLNIDHYDKKKDECLLNYANKETKEAIWNGMRTYIPSEKKFFEETEWFTPTLRRIMNNPNPNITEFIAFLDRVGFPRYYVALDDKVAENEVKRRLLAILETADILSQETYQFFSQSGEIVFTEGDIDVTTRGLPINFVIEIKCGTGKEASSALDAIKQQMEYATKTEEKRISFREALGSENRLYLLSIHFKERDGGTIDEWIFLPFFDGRLRFDKLETSSEKLFNDVKNLIPKMKIDTNYIVDFKKQ